MLRIIKDTWGRIADFEMWTNRKTIHVRYKEHTTKEEVLNRTISKGDLKNTIMKRTDNIVLGYIESRTTAKANREFYSENMMAEDGEDDLEVHR